MTAKPGSFGCCVWGKSVLLLCSSSETALIEKELQLLRDGWGETMEYEVLTTGSVHLALALHHSLQILLGFARAFTACWLSDEYCFLTPLVFKKEPETTNKKESASREVSKLQLQQNHYRNINFLPFFIGY
ncbi:hypothetical protein LSTR_LSTR007806 [Laodelphax striatellus]|uniref:Uncharacterized protein n=1 Tax=Laodelphax striatellus TaxID=195883 RepID=A0A482WML6_LAOST|nr:hypothetical protein LSTR_LSTR007806 [Laodelphax striatellus]